MLKTLTEKCFSLFLSYDAPERWQRGFQDSGTPIRDNITDLHHDIRFFLIIISIFIIYRRTRIFFSFQSQNIETRRTLTLQHHTWLEVIWTVVPAVILMLIALPSYILIYNRDELVDPKITLKVIGHQWFWHYEYADTATLNFLDEGLAFDSYMLPTEDLNPVGALRLLEVDNRVVLPIHTSRRCLITSSDVIHSWAIPSLGIKLDACPGRLNQIGLNINRVSVFYGQCSEICGINHSFRPIAIESCNLPKYLRWLLKV